MQRRNFRGLKIKKEDLVAVKGDGVSKTTNSTFQYRNYYLKFNTDSAPNLVQYEYLCNQIADRLELSIPFYDMIDVEGEPAFITEKIEGKLIHAYDYLQGGEYTLSEIIKRTYNANDFIDMCLFDALILNTDRHAYNFLYRGGMLGPMIDNHTSYALKAFQNTGLSIPVYQTMPQPSLPDYLRELISLGYQRRISLFLPRLMSSNIIELVKEKDLGYNKEEFLDYLDYSIGELYATRTQI